LGKWSIIFLGVLAVRGAPPQQLSKSSLPPDSEIRKILVQRVDAWRQSVGIVAGVLDAAGPRIVANGKLNQGDPRTLDGDTLFEIGSITKVFTALLLAEMVERGEVALTDPVAKYLPDGVKVPEHGGKAITLVDLATHTSGLPPIPGNIDLSNAANPYANYTAERLYQFLSGFALTRDIGAQYEYSNLGGGLLGHALARRAGTDYESLVRARIFGPLHVNDTRITLTPEMKARLALGHNAQMVQVPNWDFDVLAGCGALRSTANDLLKFLAANLGIAKSPLAPAMAAMLRERRPTGAKDLDIALGWHVRTANGREIVWHNGGTGGYRSFLGFDLKTRAGVVLLSNASTQVGVDDIGGHLLDPELPLMPAPKIRTVTHTRITMDPAIYDRYAGRYDIPKIGIAAVSRQSDKLFMQIPGQRDYEIYPEAEKLFYMTGLDAEITFDTDASGRATGLVLHQNGSVYAGKRLE
jgi:CubicO group peptidase (beta-lactamase class C family)